MKLENVLKLEKYCEHYDDSCCFAKDHDSLDGVTCQNCIYGNEVIEKLLLQTENFLEALKKITQIIGGEQCKENEFVRLVDSLRTAERAIAKAESAR